MSILSRIIFTPDTTAPSVPVNLVATGFSQSTIRLTWSASSDAQSGIGSYAIYRSTTSGGTYSLIGSSLLPNFDDTTLAGTQTRFYKVLAIDGAGNPSALSAVASATTPDQTAPSVPGTPSLVSATTTSISLTWAASTDTGGAGLQGYDVERNGVVVVTGTPSNSYTNTGLASGTSYTYRIRARDLVSNVSAFSTAASLSTASPAVDVTAPPVPTGLAVSVISSSQLNVSWNASIDVAGGAGEPVSGTKDYRVYRSTDGVSYSLWTTVTTPSYSDTGLAASTSYWYRVTARDNALNESTQSSASSATTQSAGGAAAATADWLARSTAPGVVWAHDFQTAAEVNNFRISGGIGNDPNNLQGNDCIWIANGITGGALQFTYTPSQVSRGSWNRPFSPLNSGAQGNGRSTADAAMNGTLTRQAWNPNSTGQCGTWGRGYYVNTAHQNHATRGWTTPGTPGVNGFTSDNIAGTDFWIQVRCKMPASRTVSGQPDGKLAMVLITGDGPVVGTGQPRTPNQEVVVKSNPSTVYQMYTNFGNRSNSFLTGVQGSGGGGAFQPGSEYETSSQLPAGGVPSNSWAWTPDEWWTFLLHVVPGTDGGNGDNPIMNGNTHADTTLEVWCAKASEWEYTKTWEKTNYVWSFGETDPWPYGFNCLALNMFLNDATATQTMTHQYAQVIFSREFIPCPLPIGATATPTWFAAMADQSIAAIAGNVGQRLTDAAPPVNLRPAADYDIGAIFTAWTGGGLDPQRGELILAANGGHVDGCGNDVFGLPVRTETPAWRRLTNPTINTDPNDVSFTDPGYSDGKIRAYHGWNRTCFGAGKIWTEPEGTYKNGWRQTNQWSFDRRSLGEGPFPVSSANAPWTNHGNCMPSATPGLIETQAGPSAFDPVGYRVWNCPSEGANASGQSFWSIHCGTKVKSQHNLSLPALGGNPQPIWMAVAYDLRLLVVGCFSGQVVLLDLKNPTSLTLKSTTGTAAAGEWGPGAHYHRKSRAILCWDGYGATVRKLTIPSNPFTGSWAWTTINFSGATPTAAPPAGTYGKFNLIENMGNSQSALVVCNNWAEASYVFKLPLAGV